MRKDSVIGSIAVWLLLGSIEVFAVSFESDVRPIFEAHCLECHNEVDRKGGVGLAYWHEFDRSLKSKPELVKAGAPGDSLLVATLTREDDEDRMPLGRAKLSASQIQTIREWIQAGANWPDEGWRPEEHWAYVAPKRATVPGVSNPKWCRTPIDYFVLQGLDEAELTPSPEAERANLLRRVWLDLIGLPPPVETVSAFVADPREDALERVVDSLLASPRFGEKWARHWLDLARYADSEGYQRDELREIWPYRDWVIRALNEGLPFDVFTIEQLAGDLLPSPSIAQQVATGFHRNTPVNLEAGTDPSADYHKQIVDRVATTGTVWLGSTIACAQCHDHKYDPFSIQDYYQLFAFFNQAPEETRQKGEKMGNSGMVYIGPDVVEPDDPSRERRREFWLRKQETVLRAIRQEVDPVWNRAAKGEIELTKAQAMGLKGKLNLEGKKRSPADYRVVGDLLLHTDSQYVRLEEERDRIERTLSRYPERRTRVMRDQSVYRQTRVMKRGDRTALGAAVGPATPTSLHPFPDGLPENRLGLARWLVSPQNPLVARVTVNRLWAELFGQGLVQTVDDFGRQGDRPSHPELLDWLAVTFVEDDRWSIKQTLRRMILSSVYRQSTEERKEPMVLDPDNRLWWRHPGHRLSAEGIRDAHLSIAGLLSESMGGRRLILGSQKACGGLRQELGLCTTTWHKAKMAIVEEFTRSGGGAPTTRALPILMRRIVGPALHFGGGAILRCRP